MPRGHERKTSRGSWEEQAKERAIAAVNEGTSYRVYIYSPFGHEYQILQINNNSLVYSSCIGLPNSQNEFQLISFIN
jgi:hypothetical protein